MAAEVLGGRLLGEVETVKLEEFLIGLRKLDEADHGNQSSKLCIPQLESIWKKHGGKLEITGPAGGRLLYHIVSTVVSPPVSKTVVVIDAQGGFDITQLSCGIEDLKHVHLYKPSTSHVREAISQVEDYLWSGEHGSMSRTLAAVIVCGADGGDITVGWRGWLHAESGVDEIGRFRTSLSAEEAMGERDQRQAAIDSKQLKATSDWEEYRWIEG